MTLQNGMKTAQKAYLWSDTACWDMTTGEITGHLSKVVVGKGWPWAGALATHGPPPSEFVSEIAFRDVSNLDNMLASAVEALRVFVAKGGLGRVLLASYEGKPRLHMIACHEVFPGSGYGPFEPVELGYMVCSCNDSPAAKVAERQGYTLKRMRRVIDAQCVTPWEGHGTLSAMTPRPWVGGDVMRIEVGADGVTSAVERTV